MEEKSSSENLVAKVRKPYTITKQREKWTEEEHSSFLEALKLYGRAWQRIEEHIGTKTAVQIRSHAQKFFTKLEKEAAIKGVSPKIHDVDIPPPRPKRKPSNPYPRKTSLGSISPTKDVRDDKSSISLSLRDAAQQAFCSESDAAKERSATTETKQAEENSGDGSCSEVLDVKQDVPSASFASLNKVNKELVKEGKSYQNQETGGSSISCTSSQINSSGAIGSKSNQHIQLPDLNMNDDRNGLTLTHPRDTDVEKTAAVAGQEEGHATGDPLKPTVSAAPKLQNISPICPLQHQFPSVSLFSQHRTNQDAHDSVLNLSSTFSSLIISTLSQNPSVHAAANLAASLWPSAEVDYSLHSSQDASAGEVPERHMKPSPNMTSIVAATVAAAAAWWASQGPLPCFPHFAFPLTSAPTTTIPSAEILLAPERNNVSLQDPQLCHKVMDQDPHAQKTQHLSSELPSSSPNADRSMTDENSNCIEPEADKDCKIGHRTSRSSRSTNESRKEASEEGRLADGAILKEAALPQNFSPPNIEYEQTKDKMPTEVDCNREQSASTTGIRHENSKTTRTGFKPYKRCSAEAKENKAMAREAGNKKIRLPEEA